MTWIEGVGDEVPIFFILAILVVMVFMVLAWKSTDVPEPSGVGLPLLALNVSSRETLANQSTSSNGDGLNNSREDYPSQEMAGSHLNLHASESRQEETNTSEETVLSEEATARDELRIRHRLNNPHTNSQDIITVKLMYMDDTQRLVESPIHSTIKDFKQKHFMSDLNANKIVKLIFNGQVLSEESTLSQLGLDNNSVVHCLIHQPRSSNNAFTSDPAIPPHFTLGDPPPRNPSQQSVADAGIDIGGLLVPLFGVILGLLWYCRIAYATHFTAAATTALVGLSGICIFSFLIIWYPNAEQEG